MRIIDEMHYVPTEENIADYIGTIHMDRGKPTSVTSPFYGEREFLETDKVTFNQVVEWLMPPFPVITNPIILTKICTKSASDSSEKK